MTEYNEFYLDSFIIIHNPPFMIMIVGKAMIMLPIVANLKFNRRENVRNNQIALYPTEETICNEFMRVENLSR